MTKQSFTIQAIVEKPIVLGSDTNKLNFTRLNSTALGDSTEYQIAESEHAGLQAEWFPFQDRFTATKPHIGVYAAGSYSVASVTEYAPYDEDGDGYYAYLTAAGGVDRLDVQYGIKMAMDVPLKKGGIAPYAKFGIHHTIYNSVIDWNKTVIEGDFAGIVWKPLDFVDVFNPEAGIDVALGKIGKADLLLNAHAQWLDFNGYDGTNQLLIGGGVGLGF